MQKAFPPEYYTSDINHVVLGWVEKTQHTKTHTAKTGSGKMNFIADILQFGGCFFGLSQWGRCIALLGPRYPEFYRKSCLFCKPSRPSPALLLLGGLAFAPPEHEIRQWLRSCTQISAGFNRQLLDGIPSLYVQTHTRASTQMVERRLVR